MKRMNGMQAFEAMTDIDPQYILKCAPDAPVKVKHRGSYLRVAAIAAALAVLAIGSVIGWGSMNRGKNPSPTLPSEQGSGNAADSADTQESTQTPTESMPPVTESRPPEEESKPSAPINGSYTTDKYTVEEIEGKHYISFADGNEKPTAENGDELTVITGIYFASLEEMQKKFLTGDFTEKEILQLKGQLTLTDKGFEIPDMTKLYDAVLPEGWSVKYLSLSANRILFSVQNDMTYNKEQDDDAGESGYIALLTDDRYEREYKKNISSYIEEIKNNKIESITDFQGIPCSVYEKINDDVKLQIVMLKFEQGDCSYEVKLTYCLAHPDKELVNDKVPYDLEMYGNMKGQKFKIYLSGFEQEITSDFLKAFAIRPLELVK